jgi:hypothetical protein
MTQVSPHCPVPLCFLELCKYPCFPRLTSVLCKSSMHADLVLSRPPGSHHALSTSLSVRIGCAALIQIDAYLIPGCRVTLRQQQEGLLRTQNKRSRPMVLRRLSISQDLKPILIDTQIAPISTETP